MAGAEVSHFGVSLAAFHIALLLRVRIFLLHLPAPSWTHYPLLSPVSVLFWESYNNPQLHFNRRKLGGLRAGHLLRISQIAASVPCARCLPKVAHASDCTVIPDLVFVWLSDPGGGSYHSPVILLTCVLALHGSCPS